MCSYNLFVLGLREGFESTKNVRSETKKLRKDIR